MLYEDAVVDALADYLRGRGWEILVAARSTQLGDDLIAARDGQRLVVEAKGEGSAVATSKRYGKPFDKGQINVSASVAVMRQLRLTGTVDSDTRLGVAFPDTDGYRSFVGPATPALHRASIGVFWVDRELGVTVDTPWSAEHV